MNQMEEVLEIIKENPKKDIAIINFFVARRSPSEDPYTKRRRTEQAISRLHSKGMIKPVDSKVKPHRWVATSR